MTPISRITGIAAPLPMPNIDTDQIMPKQFLKGTDKSGLIDGLFHDLRRRADGSLDPGFVLNQHGYREAAMLVTGPNFGCGSSREHAVWGLMQSGIRCIVSTSFANIFAGNALKNGLLLVQLNPEDMVALFERLAAQPIELDVDLPAQRVSGRDFDLVFEMPTVHKHMLLNGIDQIEFTLRHVDDILHYERSRGIVAA